MRKLFTHFPARIGRSMALLMMLLLPLLGWGQTTIATQDFETTPATPAIPVTVAGGAYYTGNSASGDRPASTPFNSTTGGNRAYGVTGGSATITSGIIDVSTYTSIAVGFRLASFSIGSTGNGSDQTDVVTLAISTDGGANYSNEVVVAGGATSAVSNTYWSFTSGTGIATRAYAGTNAATTFGPTGGGARTSDGYSTVSVTGIAATSQLRFRITMLNNSSSERWVVDDLLLQTTSSTPSPSIVPTPSSLSGFTYVVGNGPSASQSFTLGGTNLTAGTAVSITAPATYEVSLSAASGYAASLSLPNTAGGTLNTTIYVRLVAGRTAATYNQNVAITGGGTSGTTNVAVAGSVTAAPAGTITVTGGPLTAFNTLAGTPSAAQALTVGGSGLGTNDLVVTPPAGYEISVAGGPYQTTAATLTPTSGTVAGTSVALRLTGGTATASLGSTLQIRSTNSPSQDQAVSGTVVAEPATAPTVVAGTPGATTVTLTLSNNSGSRYLVVVRPAGSLAVAPTDATTYTASAAYGATGANATTGADNYVVYAATGTTVNVTGLTASTAYVADVYAYNVGSTAGFENYLATAGTTGFTTAAPPATPLLAYNFTAGDTPSTQDANVTGSAFSRVGVSSNAGSGRYNSTGWTGGAIDDAKYVQFTFMPNAGYQANLTSLSFVDQRSASTAGAYAVRVSADGFATYTTLLSGTTTGGAKSATISGFASITTGTSVTFRFYYANSGTYSVDDVQLFGTLTPDTTPRLGATPGTLAFTATTGQAAATSTYTLSGANLAANATITLSSNDPAVLLSTTGGAPFAATTTVSTSATGTLSQVVTVEFTAPATPGTTTATISNTDGTRTATVVVTGTATAPPPPTITSFTPISGPEGTVVTLTGTGFVAGTSVSFNGTPATVVTVVSATSIQATVPVGATTGTLSVSNANGSATSTGTFTVTGPPAATLAAGYLLLEDDFNYVAGTTLNNNGWATHSGASSADQPTVEAGNLTKTTYPTGPRAANANQILVNSTGADVNKGFTVPTGQNTLYYSVLLNVPIDGTFPDYFLHLLERTNVAGTNTANFRAKLFARAGTTANTFSLGVSVTSNSGQTPAPVYTTTEYAEGTTYLAVVKYEYVPGGRDVVSLFVFDNAAVLPATEPTTPDAGPLAETNNASFSLPNGIAIRQTNISPNVNLDGVRVATGWGSVVGNTAYAEATATINAGNYYRLALSNAGTLEPVGAVNVEQTLDLTSGFINTSATNSLTLYPEAAVSGGSATSFVNGPLQRTVPAVGNGANVYTSYAFPVGKAGAYRPLSLNVNTQTNDVTYSAEQFEGNPGQLGTDPTANDGTTLTRVSRVRSFTLTPQTAPVNFQGTVTLSFAADDRVTTLSRLVVAKRADSSQPWTNISALGGTSSGSGYLAGSLTSGAFASFSDFALASTEATTTANPLPVELSSFGAQRQPDKAVAIRWTTASEKNSARFEVQRSLNARDFVTVATEKAQGTSTKATSYATQDAAAPAAQLYYRLRQIDLDGTVAYSPVATVAGLGAPAQVLLYPNPAHRSIRFATEAATPYRVLNQLGQAVLHGTTEAGTAQLAIEHLPTGLYFLELQTATGRTVQKFEKD